MQKWIVFFLLVTLCPLEIFGAHQLQYANFVSPKYVKSTSLSKHSALPAGDHDSKIYSTITPEIHQGIWPDFCVHHLQNHPEECSAWGEGKHHPLNLELYLYGYSHAHIDRELIDGLGHLIYLIPASMDPKNYKHHCRYATCSDCHQTVIHGVDCSDEDFEEDDPQSYVYYLIRRCECGEYKWVEEGIPEGWNFCEEPTIYSGYLDWNNKIYFHHLKNLLIYLEENTVCAVIGRKLTHMPNKLATEFI